MKTYYKPKFKIGDVLTVYNDGSILVITRSWGVGRDGGFYNYKDVQDQQERTSSHKSLDTYCSLATPALQVLYGRQ